MRLYLWYNCSSGYLIYDMQLKNASILVVDDDPSNRKILTELLRDSGHHLLEACDGAEALESARAWHPDLIITDLLMPTMDGYEFTRQLRADPTIADTHIIFYTAHYLEHQAQLLADVCGASLITKPSPLDVILRKIETVLESIATAAAQREHAAGGVPARGRTIRRLLEQHQRDERVLRVVGVDRLHLERQRERVARAIERRLGVEIAPDALNLMREYAWPGNVRELENEARRVLVMASQNITVEHLSPRIHGRPQSAPSVHDLNVRSRVDQLEAELVRTALDKTQGNQTRAAELLGILRGVDRAIGKNDLRGSSRRARGTRDWRRT